MYLDEIASRIRSHIPDDRIPSGNVDELLRLYAILVRAKGTNVTESDIHDAWSAWMAQENDQHDALIPYKEIPADIQAEDAPFAIAVRRTAEDLLLGEGSQQSFTEVLFPSGVPRLPEDTKQALELYKIMVASSEGLVSRRQAVNTFFLTINGALLTASGLIVQGAKDNKLAALGIFVLVLAGAILCLAWRSLITSFGQLNTGKFKVINTMERHLGTAIYAAEWEALGRGKNSKIYRSFTSREIWVPNALLVLHTLAALITLLVALGFVSLNSHEIKPDLNSQNQPSKALEANRENSPASATMGQKPPQPTSKQADQL